MSCHEGIHRERVRNCLQSSGGEGGLQLDKTDKSLQSLCTRRRRGQHASQTHLTEFKAKQQEQTSQWMRRSGRCQTARRQTAVLMDEIHHTAPRGFRSKGTTQSRPLLDRQLKEEERKRRVRDETNDRIQVGTTIFISNRGVFVLFFCYSPFGNDEMHNILICH